MKVRNKLIFGLSVVFLVAAVCSAILQAMFLFRAEHGTGVVREMRAENVRCGRRNRSKCTEFKATVEVQSSAGQKLLVIDSGREKGHSLPLSKARDQVGDRVPVVFDPGRPAKAHRDEAWDIWRLPVGLLILQLGTLVVSLFKPSGRREPDEPVTLNLQGPPGAPSHSLGNRDGRAS